MASGYTTTQRDALQEAIASGVLTVEYDGKRVTYRSLEEMKDALSMVLNGLASDGGTTRTRRVELYTSKGF